MIALALIALASASCVCQTLSVADGCTETSGPYSDCDYYNAEVQCNASLCAEVKISKAHSACSLLCDCAPYCSADLLQDNVCQDQCNTASCFYDGGDCTGTTLTSCTSVEAYEYEVCMRDLVLNDDNCIYTNRVLDCFRTTGCLYNEFMSYCTRFADTYPECSYTCVMDASYAPQVAASVLSMLA